jgi:hypothetical protein
VVAAAGSACSGRGPGAGGTGGLQRSGDATTRWLLLPSSLGDESGPVSPWSSVGGGAGGLLPEVPWWCFGQCRASSG